MTEEKKILDKKELDEKEKKTTEGEISLEDMDDVTGGFLMYPPHLRP